jgi:hypothetical protein
MIASHRRSDKTAYLPVFQRLKRQEVENGLGKYANRAYSYWSPTRELTDQISMVAKLALLQEIRTAVANAGYTSASLLPCCLDCW